MPGSLSGPSITVSPATQTAYTVTGTDQWNCTASDDATVFVNSLPTVTASSATPDICVGASASLNAGGAASYMWQPGALPGATVSVSPVSQTTYTVTGTDANGCQNTATVTITVHQLPVINAGTDQDICTNASATLTASGAGLNGSYTWNPGAQAGNSITVTPAVTTTYTVSGTDSWGCTGSDQVKVTVHNPPPVSAGADKQICEGASTTLTASGAQSYVWQPGGQTTTTISVSGLPVGTHAFDVTGTDQWGCVATDQVNVTVNPLPTITVSPDVDICFGESTNISAGGASTYTWQPGAIPGSPVPVSPTTTTTYTVTGTDGFGCSNTNSLTVTVKPLPSVDAGLDVAVCIGQSTQLNASGADTYTWIGAGLSDPNIANPVATPAVTTNYQVTGVGLNGCSNTDVVVVDVNPLPNIVANPTLFVYKGQCGQLTASGGVSYQWTPPTFLDDPFSDKPMACPDDTMVYYVTGVDQNGCVNTDSTIIYVIGIPIAKIPTAFTPNGDGVNDDFRIEVYENFNMHRMAIYNRWGDLIFETADIINGWDGTGFGRNQPIGTYVYTIEGADEKGMAIWRQGQVTLIR
jgi:gliding motility-associated-like protein